MEDKRKKSMQTVSKLARVGALGQKYVIFWAAIFERKSYFSFVIILVTVTSVNNLMWVSISRKKE